MTKEIIMPRLSETMEDGRIIAWYKKPGDRISKGDIIAEVETDKATMEIEASDNGSLSEIIVQENDIAEVGVPIATLDGKPKQAKKEERKEKKSRVEEKSAGKPEKEGKKPEEAKQPEGPEKAEGIKSSPIARKLARDNNVDLNEIKGSGPAGRIVEQDVKDYLKKAKPEEKAAEEKPEKAEPGGKVEKPEMGEKEIRELSRMRRTIAKRMTASKQEIPHFYVVYDVDAENLVKFYRAAKEEMDEELKYNDIFIKASALALQKNPFFNAHFEDNRIEVYKEINIGFGLAVNEGVIVPVVRNCQEKSLAEIAKETKEIKKQAKTNKLKPKNMTGGTFTISNLGMYGVKEFVPIINQPEILALAVGTISKTPVVRDNEVTIGNCLTIVLSADHRALDGAEASKFLADLKDILENPEQIE